MMVDVESNVTIWFKQYCFHACMSVFLFINHTLHSFPGSMFGWKFFRTQSHDEEVTVWPLGFQWLCFVLWRQFDKRGLVQSKELCDDYVTTAPLHLWNSLSGLALWYLIYSWKRQLEKTKYIIAVRRYHQTYYVNIYN